MTDELLAPFVASQHQSRPPPHRRRHMHVSTQVHQKHRELLEPKLNRLHEDRCPVGKPFVDVAAERHDGLDPRDVVVGGCVRQRLVKLVLGRQMVEILVEGDDHHPPTFMQADRGAANAFAVCVVFLLVLVRCRQLCIILDSYGFISSSSRTRAGTHGTGAGRAQVSIRASLTCPLGLCPCSRGSPVSARFAREGVIHQSAGRTHPAAHRVLSSRACDVRICSFFGV
mmetsp:Transcript_33720/g.65636  ORF Transcript_33720/g.65636 Transcript_33720/m.65636 type:complete len:227 (+) Transcript_33720:382-1062(+)